MDELSQAAALKYIEEVITAHGFQCERADDVGTTKLRITNQAGAQVGVVRLGHQFMASVQAVALEVAREMLRAKALTALDGAVREPINRVANG